MGEAAESFYIHTAQRGYQHRDHKGKYYRSSTKQVDAAKAEVVSREWYFPLPALMGAQILGWGQRELTLNVIEPMGSLLQERDEGHVFFHAALTDWLKDPKVCGTHCVETSGAYQIADFLWHDREAAIRMANTSGFYSGDDGFTAQWMARSDWIKRLKHPGYSARYWLNVLQQQAKGLAAASGDLAREVEYSRRLVSLAYEAWGGAHDIFAMAKLEWEELRDRQRSVE